MNRTERGLIVRRHAGAQPPQAFSVTTDSDTDTLVTPDDTEAVSSVEGAHARLGNFFCRAALYLGWL